nr:hypothetical protein [Tanacetum cinerariifolium]
MDMIAYSGSSPEVEMRWWGWCGVAASCGWGRMGEWRRVVASGVVGLIDRETGSIFGVRQKSFLVAAVVAGGGQLVAGCGGRK